MFDFRRLSARVLLSAAVLLCSSTAFAQATRTWVSGVGDDANPCSRTAPCKTFAGAISKTAAGGEIDVLDPGGFGAVTITKAITISGDGNIAGVLVSGTNGIIVQAGLNDVVTLRHLDFQGIGTGLAGISYKSGAALYVEDCDISEFATAGILVAPVVSPATMSLFVRNTSLRNNYGPAGPTGPGRGDIGVMGASGVVVSAVLSNVNSSFSSQGLNVSGGASVAVYDSVFTGHSYAGVVTETDAGAVSIERGLIAGNGFGVLGNALVRLSDVMLSLNSQGLSGLVASFGNNRVSAGNTTDGAPSSALPLQ